MRRTTLLLGLWLWTSGCGGCSKPPPVVDAGPERSVADETVQPVYKAQGAPLPEAVRLCDAIHNLPESRAAACCHRPPNPTFAEHCADVLSAALRGGNLALDPARVDACLADLDRVHAGCEWVGPFGDGLPQSCQEKMVVGKLAAGARCRSTLECQGALRCLGGGPTDTGQCGEAREQGGACRTAVDSLAPLLSIDVDLSHPECKGFCDHHRCRARLAPGAACVVSEQCPEGQRCLGHVCAPGGKALEGEACSGGECGAGLRCTGGHCRAPKHIGEACSGLTECGGVCVMGC